MNPEQQRIAIANTIKSQAISPEVEKAMEDILACSKKVPLKPFPRRPTPLPMENNTFTYSADKNCQTTDAATLWPTPCLQIAPREVVNEH